MIKTKINLSRYSAIKKKPIRLTIIAVNIQDKIKIFKIFRLLKSISIICLNRIKFKIASQHLTFSIADRILINYQ